MTEVQKILDLIENVEPADTATLDEIDLAVINEFWPEVAAYNFELGYKNPKYTRSRDALKAIRPEGWSLCSSLDGLFADTDMWRADSLQEDHRYSVSVSSNPLPTEELAELHAIVQAIEFEMSHPALIKDAKVLEIERNK